jgi:hypothetical protein
VSAATARLTEPPTHGNQVAPQSCVKCGATPVGDQTTVFASGEIAIGPSPRQKAPMVPGGSVANALQVLPPSVE